MGYVDATGMYVNSRYNCIISLLANHIHEGSRTDLVGSSTMHVCSSFVSSAAMALGNVSVGTANTGGWGGTDEGEDEGIRRRAL